MARRPTKRSAKKAASKRPMNSAGHGSPMSLSPPRRLHNLPAQLTSFIGRESEIAEIKHLLGTARLLTLTGAAGCGKTRLALQIASEILPEFPDGAWMADLAPLSNVRFVPQTVATALGVL